MSEAQEGSTIWPAGDVPNDASHRAYVDARKAYWDTQENFRRIAIERIQALIPDTHAGAHLEINDTPRLSLLAPILADGTDADEYDDMEGPWMEIDGIANYCEAGTWDEAESFLETHGENGFVIWKDSNR